jgi:hypothetical protein
LDNQSSIPYRYRDFSLHRFLLRGFSSLLSDDYQDLFPEDKRPERETGHSTPSGAEIKIKAVNLLK